MLLSPHFLFGLLLFLWPSASFAPFAELLGAVHLCSFLPALRTLLPEEGQHIVRDLRSVRHVII
jgi:hypothetical protein